MIVLDISRLVTRAARLTPTGIDRVELAYARHLIASPLPPGFARVAFGRWLVRVPQPAVERYIEALGAVWREGPNMRRRRRVGWAVLRLRLAGLSPSRLFPTRMRRELDNRVYLLVSHHHLERRRLLAKLKRRHRMSFVCLVHDLIPIEFPEYTRPGQNKRHHRRIETVGAVADAVIVPSAATDTALRSHIAIGRRNLRPLVAPFGVELPSIDTTQPHPIGEPYFVCLGTIEARKNHLLLLNLWRDFVTRTGCKLPKLVLIGRRGWEVENTIDMLDRCPALRGIVSEHGTLPDTETVRLLNNAQALLLPTHAEGFGFPLVEALACGTPVLCSDIPALREIGGAAPEYFDPLDGAAWRAAILDYAADPSARREAQLRRMANWQPPRWADHFAAVDALIAGLTAAPAPR